MSATDKSSGQGPTTCPSVTLNNGVVIPLIGLGTWAAKPGEVQSAVKYAIKDAGYRHIDCAWAYGNEKEVGEGIQASGIPRSELFITSKLWSSYHSRVEQCLDETLAKLGTGYVDLYLIHWPIALNPNGNDPFIPTLPNGKRDVLHDWDQKDTWAQMEALYKKGKVKAIGVSNFSEMMLEKILPTAEIIPAVDQLELHVYNPQHELIAYLREKGIVPQAFSPLGSAASPLLADDTVIKIAKKHALQPADVLIGYHVSKGTVALPKSVRPERIASNYEGGIAASQKLDPTDIEELDDIATLKQKRLIMPPWPVDLGFKNWTATV